MFCNFSRPNFLKILIPLKKITESIQKSVKNAMKIYVEKQTIFKITIPRKGTCLSISFLIFSKTNWSFSLGYNLQNNSFIKKALTFRRFFEGEVGEFVKSISLGFPASCGLTFIMTSSSYFEIKFSF